MISLNDNQKIKLKTFYTNKQYSNFEQEIESLGSFEKLPDFLKAGYAGSKILNPQSVKRDYKLAVVILGEVYAKNKNIEFLYNLITASIKAETYTLVLPNLMESYKDNKKDLRIIEGLAKINFNLGNIDLSVKYYNQLLELAPIKKTDGPLLTYLFSKNYVSNISQENYFEECLKVQDIFENNYSFSYFKKNHTVNKKLKIGFVSGDFKQHSVGIFFKSFIKRIDKNHFDISGFSNLELKNHDDETKKIKIHFNHWYDVFHFTDKKLVETIRSLNLDILIDLSGYSYGNRINVFAARCAPIQITWLGYNNSTGLKNMDYILTDPNLIKKNEKALYSEKILYLPKIWNAMEEPQKLPNFEKHLELADDDFIYGSFNNFKKISNETIKAWSEILNNSNSKLYLKNSLDYNEEINTNIKNKFLKFNVDLSNITFLKRKKNVKEHLQDYQQVDLSLDTFPYTGVTTSFESNMMGVPVLTLKGFNFNSRCGESINKNLGLPDYIASNTLEYINKAILFSKNKNLIFSREQHRQKTFASSLFDIHNFTKKLSQILQSLKK